MKSLVERAKKGAAYLLQNCGGLSPNDRILIIHDPETRSASDVVCEAARGAGFEPMRAEAPVAIMHGQEPPQSVAAAMATVTLIVGMTSKSMAHTQARIDAGAAGARYLSLPEYSLALLADPGLIVDYRGTAPRVRRVTDIFTKGRRARVTTDLGTDVTLNIEGRVGNCCSGIVTVGGDLGSPPDIESNVSPVEADSEGVLIVDGSIPYPGLGLLQDTVLFRVRGGRISDIECKRNGALVKQLDGLFSLHDPAATRVLAELGLGFNDKASLSGVMLSDEGAAGTGHFGFGSNSTVGGKNSVPFHLDCVFRKPTVVVDGFTIMMEGQLQC